MISVIIPTRNRAPILKRCLEHLAAQQNAPTFEVIVVNDGGTDDTKDIITNYQLPPPRRGRRITNLKYLEQPPSQQGVARNLGVQHAQGDILLFIGDDIFVPPDFIRRHFEAHQKNSAENMVVLGFSTWHSELPINYYMRFLERGWQFNYPLLKPGFIDGPVPAWKFFYTSNLSMKKSFFQKEPFDPGFQGYGWEDIELAYRLWKNHGMQIFYEPEAKAHHYHQFTEADLPKKMQQIGRAAMYFQKLHPDIPVVPRGWKWLVIQLAIHCISRPIAKLFGHYFYYRWWSWKEFFSGLSDAHTR